MVKLLDEPTFDDLNVMLEGLEVSGTSSSIRGHISAFSCKLAGDDKQMSKSLESQFMDEIHAGSPNCYSESPVGPLTDAGSRRTLINLILTLNASFPDHEFSSLRAESFVKQVNLEHVAAKINRDLSWGQVLAQPGSMLSSESPQDLLCKNLWAALANVVVPDECSVYSYIPEDGWDPLSGEDTIWAFNYFFYNKRLKRIAYFVCSNSNDTEGMDDGSDDDMFGGMDEMGTGMGMGMGGPEPTDMVW